MVQFFYSLQKILLTYKYHHIKYINIINVNHKVNATSKNKCNNILVSKPKENIFRYGKLKSFSLYSNNAFEK